MISPKNQKTRVIVCGMLLLLPLNVYGWDWQPSAAVRNAAIDSGNLSAYYGKLTAWLDKKVATDPEKVTKEQLQTLLVDRAFVDALAERHFIGKVGGATVLDTFAKADLKNKEFVRWVLSNAPAMDEMMLARTPSAMFARIDDSHNVSIDHLRTWQKIYETYPESRKGIYLKLAIASVIRPPGTGNRGAGGAKKHSDSVARFAHFLKAHKNDELVPSFDDLSAWEMTHIVSSCASDADLAWGREALNTWNPDFKRDERIVMLTSQVRRTGSQIPYNDFSCVMAGGGQCGPRSSFGVFINQAFGIPSIGVGQPAHAAIAYRNRRGDWKVCFGRSWHVSKLFDRYKMSGHEFIERTDERNSGQFAQLEHLRWLAALIENPQGAYLPPAHRRYNSARAKAVMHMANHDMKPVVIRGIIEPRLFINKADKTTGLPSFEGPENAGDNYAARIRGFLYPPKSGEYSFRIAADDYADLFLSTDDHPEHKVQIAHVGIYTDARQFDKRSQQTSKPIRLEAGKRYLIEALQTESAGGDNLAVAWSGPGVTEGIIPGEYLAPYSHPDQKGSISREVWDGSSKRGAVAKSTAKPEKPIKVAPGVIHVEAEDFAHQGGIGGYGYPGVPILDCYDGGKQVHFGVMMQSAWVGYKIQVPETGIYELTTRVSAVNWGQRLHARSFGAMYAVKSATASDVFGGQVKNLGPLMAIDNNLSTRWAMNFGKDKGWIELDLGEPRKFSKIMIDERGLNRVSKFVVEYQVGDDWKILFAGDKLEDFRKDFPPVTAQHVRLTTLDTNSPTGGPTIREFSVGEQFDGSGWINIHWSTGTAIDESTGQATTNHAGVAGRWQTTKPLDMRLVKGEQTIWLSAPYQRGLSMRWFELTPKEE